VPIKKNLHTVPLDLLKPGRYQAREIFGQEDDVALVEQIRTAGEVFNPIWVAESGDQFEILAGERRWRCAQIAGLETVPVFVFDVAADSLDAAGLGAIENLQRKDLNAIEQARLFQTLIDDFGLTHQSVADTYLPGRKGRTVVSSRLRLLTLSESIQQFILEGRLTGKHGEQLLRLDDLVKRKSFAREAVKKNWSVKALDNAISSHLDPNVPIPDTPTSLHLEKKYSSLLGVNVKIKQGRSGCTMTASTATIEQLEEMLAFFDPIES
jgi:ParB family transcriptional regulator, chromosome partitioning protein